ncbi:MAG TPA: MFS transporter [Clostridia bacterium]|nr:MFS transporter [Clostridia bacterium]
MATETNTAAVIDGSDVEEVKAALPPGRKYVGTKEAFSFILYDVSYSFNIKKYEDLFITDILRIGLKFQQFATLIIGIWDVINDVLVAALVDKTRTRFGKFKPYLIAYAIPGVALSIFYWAMPLAFSGTSPYYFAKLLIYFIFMFFNNFATTVNDIARMGFISTITPDVKDRTRLITQANLFSGFVEKAPEQIMGVMIDLINHNVVKIKMTSLYVGMGVFTVTVSGVLALMFAFVAKERVMQSVETPSIKDSLRSIITNKPLLLLTLSDFLSAFSVGTGMNYYFVNVLKLATMSTIVGIPGGIISPLSYIYVPWAREKFSTKTLWISGAHLDNFLLTGVFLIGSVNKNYKKLGAMIPAFTIREFLFMFVYGIRKVIPEELRNESMDYCEWKNGFRTEGMTGVARGLANKLVRSFGGFLRALILEKIGYNQMVGSGEQSEKTEYYLFAMCTVLPVVTGIFSIVPKFFYDLTGEKRDRMYRELKARRTATAEAENEGLIDKNEQPNTNADSTEE